MTTFVREYELTVRQLVEEFGVQPDGTRDRLVAVLAAVKSLWDQGSYERPVDGDLDRHAQRGRDAPACSRRATTPWRRAASSSEPAPTARTRFLRECGFRHVPDLVPRWDVTGEDTYGTDCPGMTALGDVKAAADSCSAQGAGDRQGGQPAAEGARRALRTQKTSLLAGDITYVDVRDGQQGLSPIHEVRLEGFQYLVDDMATTVRDMIQRAFYADLFLMLAQSDDRLGADRPTAREIEERHEEKLLALGPVLERTNDELLDPLIDRTFALMLAAGVIPEAPPEELARRRLKVEYISHPGQAQKLVGVSGHDRFLRRSWGWRESGRVRWRRSTRSRRSTTTATCSASTRGSSADRGGRRDARRPGAAGAAGAAGRAGRDDGRRAAGRRRRADRAR